MTSFEAGDIIVVDYPHVETRQLKRRPALVVSAEPMGPDGLVLWAVMITSADNKRWPGDVVIADHIALGLPIPSVVRTEKISTLECDGADLICPVRWCAFGGCSVAYCGLPRFERGWIMACAKGTDGDQPRN